MIEVYLYFEDYSDYYSMDTYDSVQDFISYDALTYPVNDVSFKGLFNQLKYGVDIFYPSDDGEDFIFNYTSPYIWNFVDVPCDDFVGHKYGEFCQSFAYNLNILDLMKKAYYQEEIINFKIVTFEDGKFSYLMNESIFRDGDMLIFTSKLISADKQVKNSLDAFKEYSQGSFIVQDDKIVDKSSDFEYMEHDNGLLSPFTFKDIKLSGLSNFESKKVIEQILKHELFSYNGEICYPNLQTGIVTYYLTYLSPTLYNSQPAVLFNVVDISNNRREELRARQLEEYLRIVQLLSNCAILRVSGDGNARWSPEIFDMLEMNIDEISKLEHGRNFYDDYVSETTRDDFYEWIEKAKHDNSIYNSINKIITARGNTKYFSAYSIVKHDVNDFDSTYVISFVQDITNIYVHELELKEKNKELGLLLEEKEMLLKEVHHRVKNNLQVILSFLNLDLYYNKDNPNDTIYNTRDRIQSMALMYETTYTSEKVDVTNLNDFIEELSHRLIQVYSGGNIKLNLDIIDEEISIDIIIPLGLIINELLLNSIKYAFPSNQSGEITIKLTEEGENLVLVMSDNGVGLPKDLNVNTADSLGLKIIQTLTNQLEGNLTNLKPEKGSSIEISFPKKI